MSRFNGLPILGLAIFVASASLAGAQSQYIGFVYPAGGQQGSTFPIRLGGQGLAFASDAVVSGEGVSCRLVDYYRVLDNQEMGLVNQQLNELRRKETTVDDAMAAKMALFEFPAPIGPDTGPDALQAIICPICGTANPLDATLCSKCNAKLEKPKDQPKKDAAKNEPPKSEKEAAKQKMIDRLQRRFAEDERNPAVRSQTELVFVEITVSPDAKPGRREIRVITKRGVSNPLPFYVGQVPEVARKPMKTMQLPVLGKEYLAQRQRPIQEEEMRVTIPCTMNGQIAAGELNRYRFQASKGQRLVISARSRDLVPYVPDGVPGWFQAVLRLYDAKGKELAYSDDFRFNPDPLIYFQVPEDGEYLLVINEALFRGRESFVYRITVAEQPFVTSIVPLGGRVGEPVKIEMEGWNVEKATMAPPPKDAKPGRHLIAATNGKLASNYVQFALDTLPECLEQEPNDEPSKAQKVTLPIIINGRADRPGDWDVFEVEGKAGETIVAEVNARRLGSPYDSFVKITTADGKVIALNDDHFDAGSGYNTDHADSYLMAKLPANGKYFVHIGDTRRNAGKEYAYRLRISQPLPDFELRLIPSRFCIPSKGSASVTVFAIRKDGFDGPIKLNFSNLPAGLESPGATLGAKQEVVGLGLKTKLDEMEKPVNVTVVGTAKVGDKELVHEAVPAEDKMQAFLWRHLLPADTLPVLVYNPSYQPPADRIRPPIRDEDRPKGVKPTLQKSSVEGWMRQIERLYQEWLFTDEFANREIASVEARIIK
ncbi:MAG: zinc ribbon domain-containing protein [Verrucomicrobia bacterium]|nr:zinc ribbon domain-containing protein [Verrucomicrobiota bacterium]